MTVLDYANSLCNDTPMVIHCSAGVGRTGIWAALDISCNCIQEYREVDVTDVVEQVREDRGGMVQTYEQYQFIYKAVCAYARREGITSSMFEEDDPVLQESLRHAERY